ASLGCATGATPGWYVVPIQGTPPLRGRLRAVCGMMCRCGLQARSTAEEQVMWAGPWISKRPT
ncbi:MAG: hypothetical protein ACOX9E_11905, partial [Lentisphaeria bacterium]